MSVETVTIEKQVWESTLRASMDRAAKIEHLKDLLKKARPFVSEWHQSRIYIPFTIDDAIQTDNAIREALND